jgi:hypothetical protein
VVNEDNLDTLEFLIKHLSGGWYERYTLF